ncbi:hypothetical protein P3L10_003649 [Capsicum annuum]
MVLGLPKTKFKENKLCSACGRRKQVRSSFKSKNYVSTTKCLELVHMDLCGPMRQQSRGGKRYIFVIIDDYFRFTWTLFLASKEDAFDVFEIFIKKMEKKLGTSLVSIRADHGTEFENEKFLDFYSSKEIDHNFLSPRTPQQNGVVERKNRTLKDMARTMMLATNVAKNLWAEAMSTTTYIINRCMIRPMLEKTPYEF